MACRVCVQIPLYADGIGAKIDIQMLKTPCDPSVHLAYFHNGIKPYIFTLNKNWDGFFSEC